MIRYAKSPVKRPVCPFCGLPIDRPKELETKRPGEMPVGSCVCGAVYAYDATGHNLGPAFSEALVFACNMDWDLAWGLLPEEDYLEKLVENYDLENHFIVPSGSFEDRKVPGALYFIRLHRDIQEVTAAGVKKRIERANPVTAPSRREAKGPQGKKAYSRKELHELVDNYRVEKVLEIARKDKRVMRDLQRFLYSGEELLRLRAADILGRTSGVVARDDPAPVTGILQGLFSSFEFTASSSWGAVDAIGEIIAHTPDIFAGYIPTLYRFLTEEALRPAAVKAIARIAGERPDLIPKTAHYFIPYLKDSNPAVRGYTALLLGRLGADKARDDLKDIIDDREEVNAYAQGAIRRTTVGRLAAQALEQISGS